jgi:hypothetical protein
MVKQKIDTIWKVPLHLVPLSNINLSMSIPDPETFFQSPTGSGMGSIRESSRARMSTNVDFPEPTLPSTITVYGICE